MKPGFILIAALILMVALILPACTPASVPAPAPTPTPPPAKVETKTLKLAHPMAPTASMGKGYEEWRAEFEKRTNGRYKVEIYPSQTLLTVAAGLNAVKTGAVEMTFAAHSMFAKDFPLPLVAELPTLGFRNKNADDYIRGTKAIWELYNTFPEIQAEFKDVKLVFYHKMAPYILLTKKKEVRFPADFQGMRVGGSGQRMEIVNANGGASVYQMPVDAYTNLDKGVVDATFQTFSIVSDWRLHEIVNYCYTQDFGGGSTAIFVNPGVWNAMSPEDQKIMMDSWNNTLPKISNYANEEDEKGRKLLLDAGKKIVEPTPDETAAWEKAAEPAINKWIADCKAQGLDPELINKILAGWKNIRLKYVK